jgi:hypothetical protein
MLCSVLLCFHVWGLSVLKQLSYIVSISLGLLREKVNLFAKWTKLCPYLHANQSNWKSHYESLQSDSLDLELKRVVTYLKTKVVNGPTLQLHLNF